MFYVRHLTLRYGIQTLFDDAEFTIKSPGLYLLKGKNGYGKTTLFKILKGLIPSPCQIQFGQKQDPFDQISYVNAKLTVFERLTVLENLLLFEKDEQKIADLIRQVGLSDQWKKKKTKNLSAGEKQRLAICMALLEDKPILLLDEPTSHVDADTAEILLQLLKHVSKNKIILVPLIRTSNNKMDYGMEFFPSKEKRLFFQTIQKKSRFHRKSNRLITIRNF